MRRYIYVLAVVAVATAVVLGGTGQAQPGGLDIYTAVDENDLGAMCEGLGYEYELSTDEADDPMLIVTLGDYVARLMLYDIVDGSASSLHLRATFAEGGDVYSMNSWNATERHSRAYVDDDDEPVIEDDLELSGGVTQETIEIFITNFDGNLARFGDFLSE